MNISLTTELEQFIQSQVASGKYTSNEEVILAGIRLLEERERIYKGRFEELQREIMIGVEQLDRQERLDGREVIEQLRQKNQALRKTHTLTVNSHQSSVISHQSSTLLNPYNR